jgi:hypothetical protein
MLYTGDETVVSDQIIRFFEEFDLIEARKEPSSHPPPQDLWEPS